MSESRITLHLDPDAYQELAAIREAGGKSAARDYISSIVRLRATTWRRALALLMQYGWASADILCACDALNGTWTLDLVGGVPLELADAQRINKLADKWEVAGTWGERVESATHADVAGALLDVVAEFWAGNAALEARLQDGR